MPYAVSKQVKKNIKHKMLINQDSCLNSQSKTYAHNCESLFKDGMMAKSQVSPDIFAHWQKQ